MQMPRATVFDRLSQSQARLLWARDLGEGFALAQWTNATDHVRYEDTRQHVLSLYTHRGQDSARLDRGGMRGHPGALSLMPQGASSDWEIGGSFAFLHLYIPDDALRGFAAETLDRQPNSLAPRDVTFADDPVLAARLAELAAAPAPVAARQALTEVLHRLLTQPTWCGGTLDRQRGGLAPRVLARVRARMQTDLDQPLRLADLAATAGLSEFHFQRAFRASTGFSPHQALERLRIARAESLIAAGEPLADVAAACGFAHHSHLTRAFRKARGVAPSVWRAATR